MRSSTFYYSVILAVTALAACGEAPTNPIGPVEGQPTIVAYSGDGTIGRAGQPVGLRARVSVRGIPVSDVAVEWRVSYGDGLFRVSSYDQGGGTELVSSMTEFTGADGVARATIIPTVVGATVVTASGTTAGGEAIGAVDFSMTATAVLIPVGDVDWEASWPAGPQDVTVAVGTQVEWGATGWWTLDWRIRSTSEPSGGKTFDSSALENGQPFSFVPSVPGEWVWEFYDGRTIKSATLTVQ